MSRNSASQDSDNQMDIAESTTQNSNPMSLATANTTQEYDSQGSDSSTDVDEAQQNQGLQRGGTIDPYHRPPSPSTNPFSGRGFGNRTNGSQRR